MECINFRKIIDQEFEKEKTFEFQLSGKQAQVTIKKIDFSTRNKIAKLQGIGEKKIYQFETVIVNGIEERELKSYETIITDAAIEAEEKIIALVLESGINNVKQNLEDKPMTITDWKDFATYFDKEFKKIFSEILVFNGLAEKKLAASGREKKDS